MKKFWLLFASAFALLTLAACSDDEDEIAPEPVPGTEPTEEYDEAYYAEHATVSSEDAHFTLTDEGGEIAFKVEGGEVVVTVDCGTEWTAAVEYLDEEEGWLDATVNCSAGALTVTADANTVEAVKTAAVTVMTAKSGIEFATISVEQNAYGACEIKVETNEWNVPAVGDDLTTEIAVEANADWEVENTAEWLTAEKTGTGLKLTASENDTTEERTAEVVLTCTDGVTSASETVTVTQDAKAYVTLSGETLAFSSDEGSASVTVESNYDLTCSTEADWFTVTVDGNVLTVAVKKNETGEDREGTVTLTAGDGAANVAETQLTVSQNTISANDMVLTYYITEAWLASGEEVYLPIAAETGTPAVNCTINWGDGTVESCTDDLPLHNYKEAGEYEIVISGTMPVLHSSSVTRYGSGYVPVTAVKQWGHTGLIYLDNAFYNCTSLVSLPEDTAGAFDDVTKFIYAFESCTGLTEIPAGLFKGCSKATTLYECFNGCTSLKEIPEGLFDDLTNVTNFYWCFRNCSSLVTVPTSLFDNNLIATNFDSTFQNCSSVVGESPYTTMSDGTKVHLYERADHTDVFAAPTNTGSCFSGSSFSDMDSIPSSWGGNN